MDLDWLIILSNVLVSVGLFVATLYRVKIEKEQIKILAGNAEALNKLKRMRDTIEKEKDMILEMPNGKEVYELLRCLTD